MPVKLQSKCINIPVTFNCYQTAESWSLIIHSCWWPYYLKVWSKIWLFWALYPTLKSSGEDFCFVLFFPHSILNPVSITRGLQPSTNTCRLTVTYTHTHTTTTTQLVTQLFRTPACSSSTTLTKGQGSTKKSMDSTVSCSILGPMLCACSNPMRNQRLREVTSSRAKPARGRGRFRCWLMAGPDPFPNCQAAQPFTQRQLSATLPAAWTSCSHPCLSYPCS